MGNLEESEKQRIYPFPACGPGFKRRISLRGVVLVRLEVSVTKPSIIAID